MHKKVYFFGALFWTTLVIFLSLVSLSKAPKIISSLGISDKAVHFVFYSVFVFIWGLYANSETKIQSRTFFYLFLYAVLLGGMMEVFQEFFTLRRTADWLDMLANCIGAFFGLIVLYLCTQKRK